MIRIIIKIARIIEFVFFYIAKVLQANVELAWHIIAPRLKMTPGIIKIPVHLSHNQAILLLVNLISMTPGTLSMDLTEDKQYIYVHCLFLADQEKTIREIKHLESKISKLFN